MKLPNAHRAVVDRRKITDYLLNTGHPDNGGKAAFFTSLGFTSDRWEVLADALRQSVVSVDVSSATQSPHGQKFIVDAEMNSPSGRRARVRSVWIIDAGWHDPRLVTAYPAS